MHNNRNQQVFISFRKKKPCKYGPRNVETGLCPDKYYKERELYKKRICKKRQEEEDEDVREEEAQEDAEEEEMSEFDEDNLEELEARENRALQQLRQQVIPDMRRRLRNHANNSIKRKKVAEKR
jgi:hypothetical protein